MRTAGQRRRTLDRGSAAGSRERVAGEGGSKGAEAPRPWAPVFDGDRAARALADFLEAARALMEQVEEHSERYGQQRPWQEARQGILRILGKFQDTVEAHDLPRFSGLSRDAVMSLAERLGEEGLVEAERDETYPNMLYLRITPAGREELRKTSLRKAMDCLHGTECRVSESADAAKEALDRLLEVVVARSR